MTETRFPVDHVRLTTDVRRSAGRVRLRAVHPTARADLQGRRCIEFDKPTRDQTKAPCMDQVTTKLGQRSGRWQSVRFRSKSRDGNHVGEPAGPEFQDEPME